MPENLTAGRQDSGPPTIPNWPVRRCRNSFDSSVSKYLFLKGDLNCQGSSLKPHSSGPMLRSRALGLTKCLGSLLLREIGAYNGLKSLISKRPPVKISPLLSVTLILSITPILSAQGRPATAGQVELRKYESAHQVEPPPQPQQPRINSIQLEYEANELSNLAESIPVDIKSVMRGTLPKDLLERLKKIEKLSKHLRGELGQR